VSSSGESIDDGSCLDSLGISNIVTAANQSMGLPCRFRMRTARTIGESASHSTVKVKLDRISSLIEVPESQVSESISRNRRHTDSTSLDITSATAGLHRVISAGRSFFQEERRLQLIDLRDGVPAANTLTLAAMPPTTSTGVHMTLSRGVGGTGRSVVIEWRDGDLVGKPLAPTRAFPPPEGLSPEVSRTSHSSTAAMRMRNGDHFELEPRQCDRAVRTRKARNFSPDTVIFTNDTPTALLRGDGVYWRMCRNSGYVIRYMGGEKPLSVEPVWEGTGVLYQHNAVLGEGGRLYLWPTRLGSDETRADGLLEGTFANDIADDLIACTDPAKRVLGWFGDKHVVTFGYEKKVWCFFPDLKAGELRNLLH
jgi:hypothetical protein